MTILSAAIKNVIQNATTIKEEYCKAFLANEVLKNKKIDLADYELVQKIDSSKMEFTWFMRKKLGRKVKRRSNHDKR